MLAIRMQRTGRSGHAQFRLIVQDSRFSPTSGRVVAYLGSYDPHAKTAVVNKEKAAAYLTNGAQPSPRAARLLKNEGVKLPDWVKIATENKRAIRHPEKLRRNRPAAEATPVAVVESEETPSPEAAAEEPKVEEVQAEAPAETPPAEETSEEATEKPAETPVEETPAEEVSKETPAEEAPVEPAVETDSTKTKKPKA